MKKPVPRASDIMDRDPVAVTENQPVRDAAEVMWKRKLAAVVLVDEARRPVGILSQQGLMLALLDVANHGMPAGPLRQYLDPGCPVIGEEAGPLKMAGMFAREGHPVRALVVVRDERLVGLVLRRDVVHAVMEFLKGVEDLQQRLLYLSALREIDEIPTFD